KVFWHAPTQRWIQTLYVALPDPTKLDANGKPSSKDTIHFFSSQDLKNWTLMSVSDGFFECPDFFELPVDGDSSKKRWVLTAASSDYEVGTFDGTRFTSESGKIKGHKGRGFYAAQTFSDLPDQRRIQIGWLQAASPGMAFNQAMSLPLELSLRTTPEGPRLCWQPAREVESLRAATHQLGAQSLKEGGGNPAAGITGELLEIRADFNPGNSTEVAFNVRGVPVVYDVKKQELIVNGHRSAAPLHDGIQRLVIYSDRTAFEVFASDGLVYIPMPVIPKADARSVEVQVKGGQADFSKLDIFELKPAWEKSPR
ncbi:MAG: glycosyl hydrolase family 32, partial [Chthoniobacteraceae bacterium]|nr:glycosyl hydrolase family 32 [Chthoniobacteraceae bacterium]